MDIDIARIMEAANTVAEKAVIDAALETINEPDPFADQPDVSIAIAQYRPLLRYTRALVAEALRLYHLEQSQKD